MLDIRRFFLEGPSLTMPMPLPQVGTKRLNYRFENGRIHLEGNPQEPLDFVVDPRGVLLFGKGHYKLAGRAQQIFGAGRVQILDGLITYMDNDSGHYLPDEENLRLMVRVFREAGLCANDLKVFDHFQGVELEV